MERYLATDDGRIGGSLGDAAAVLSLLTDIEQAALQQANLPNKSYANLTERQKFTERLLLDIERAAVWSTWTPPVRLAALRVLKIQCRDRMVAGPLFKSEGFNILLHLSGLLPNQPDQSPTKTPPVSNSSTTSSEHRESPTEPQSFGDSEWEREALKCVANAMLLEESTRDLFIEAKASDAACQLLQHPHVHPECYFILLRLLFLVTVAHVEHCRYLVDQLSIATILARFLQPNYTDAMDMMTTSECLKLLYNLCMHLPKTEDTLSNNTTTDYISPTLSERSHSGSSSQDGSNGNVQTVARSDDILPPSSSSATTTATSNIAASVSPSSPLSKSIQSSRNALVKLQQRFRRSPIGGGGRKRSSSAASSDSRASSFHRRDSPNRSEDISEEERKRLSLEFVQRKVALRFECLLSPILDMLLKWRPVTNGNPLVPPYSHAVHALLHFPANEPLLKSIWFPVATSQPYAIVDKLIYITNLTISERNLDGGANERQIDEELLPLLTLLVSLARSDEEVKLRLKEAFIPEIIDRSKPVHQGDTLSARIIRAMTAPFLTRSRNMVSEFLYILHDENPDALVERVGFGNVAGFFVMRGIQFKPPTQSSMVDTATGQAINPITGQRVDAQSRMSNAKSSGKGIVEMTQEEKEREAERLFVLFDRLNRTGVVKAVNPLAEAVKSGRFEELDDDDDDDDDDDLPSDGEGVDTDIEGENSDNDDTSSNVIEDDKKTAATHE
ncbi:guanine nucleotide exchange factor synembryn-domain-containing protein [Syncephalis plumigaleata]|nr:guanine nucleotide exchange factor synembryn-domain-containing protein [Syncephalis plumigaleata]